MHAIRLGLMTSESIKKKIMSLSDMRIYPSITEAGIVYGKENWDRARKNISRALNHNGTAFGTKWVYV